MEELIKFRHFVDSMSEPEFESVVTEICQVIGKDALVSMLFYHFQENLNQATTLAKIDQINQRISGIPDDAFILSPQIDKMSESIINEIASYLDVRSYSRFESCNRTIFIAVRSPYQLQKFIIQDNPWSINVYLRYCMENKLQIDTNKFSRLQALEFQVYPDTTDHYKNLSFDKLSELHVNLKNHNLNAFTSSLRANNINLQDLETLSINEPSNVLLNALLPDVSNLEFLSLSYLETPTIHPRNNYTFKRLKGLSLLLTDTEEWTTTWNNRSLVPENNILDLCSARLISFHTDSDFTRLNMNSALFPNLQELYLMNNDNQKVIEKIKQFKHLKRIHLGLIDYTNDSRDSLIPLTTQFMNKLFSLMELECVEFNISEKELPKLMKLIQNSLMIYGKRKLKIHIICIFDEHPSNTDIHVDFEVFVNSLNYHISEDFMLIFCGDDMLHYLPQTEITDIQKWLKNLDNQEFWVHSEPDSESRFVIANKGCKISGYRKRCVMKEDFNN